LAETSWLSRAGAAVEELLHILRTAWRRRCLFVASFAGASV